MAGNSCAPRAVIPTATRCSPTGGGGHVFVRRARDHHVFSVRFRGQPSTDAVFPGYARGRLVPSGFPPQNISQNPEKRTFVRLLLPSGRAPVRWRGRMPGKRRNERLPPGSDGDGGTGNERRYRYRRVNRRPERVFACAFYTVKTYDVPPTVRCPTTPHPTKPCAFERRIPLTP